MYQQWDVLWMINTISGTAEKAWYLKIGSTVRSTNYGGTVMMPADDKIVVFWNNDYLFGTYMIIFNPTLASPITPMVRKQLRSNNFFGGT
jgi:hypothetical protein